MSYIIYNTMRHMLLTRMCRNKAGKRNEGIETQTRKKIAGASVSNCVTTVFVKFV